MQNRTDQIILHVPGTPRPKQSARFVNGRAVGVTRAKRLQKLWSQKVEQACREIADRPAWLRGPLCVDRVFWFATDRAERHGRPHTFKPDGDNLEKMMLDCMQSAGLIGNDSSFAGGSGPWKLWGPTAGALIVLRPWTPPDWLGDDDGMSDTMSEMS
jgi:Holliday junction resolvase RusA-like endonuclease